MLLAFAVPLFVVGFLRWREAVVGSLVLALLEGALRKWFLPQFNQEMFFAKDFLLLGAYVRFFGSRIWRSEYLFAQHRANVVLAFLSCWAGLELFNPLLPNLSVGILGFMGYLFYAPLLYLTPAVVRSGAELRRLVVLFLAFAGVALVLAPIQYFSAPDSILNIYSNQPEMGAAWVSVAGAHARVTGTFSYITGFTDFLSLLSLGTAAQLALARRTRTRLLLGGGLALLLAEILMTGSRAPLVILVVGLPASVLIARFTSTPRRYITSPILFVVLVVAAATLATFALPEALQSFTERAGSADDPLRRILTPFSAGVQELATSVPFGYGLGTTYPGASVLIPSGFMGPFPPPAEVEWQRIVLEIGPLGLVAVVVLRVLIACDLWAALRHTEDLLLQPFLLGALLFTLVLLPGNVVFDHTASIFYWFSAGLALVPSGSVRQRALSHAAECSSSSSGGYSAPNAAPRRVPIGLLSRSKEGLS